MADQVVRMLDEDSVTPADRLRLLVMYLLFNYGLLPADTKKLINHAQLHPQDHDMIANLSQFGANTMRGLKDSRPRPTPLFPLQAPPPGSQDEYSLSRFSPAVHHLLAEHSRGTLSQESFPYTKPELEPTDPASIGIAPASLRSAKPTWANQRTTTSKPKQRVIVFMAGGATYSESRAVYEASNGPDKDVYLVTSHMLTPALFIRQVRDLSQDPRRLGIPALAPPKKAPEHLSAPDAEPPRQQQPPQQQQTRPPQPPTQQMASVNLQQNGYSTQPQASQQRPASKPVPHSTWQPPEEKKKSKVKKLFGSSK